MSNKEERKTWRKPLLAIARALILFVPLILFSWLIYRDLVVSGVLEAEYDFSKPSPFISYLRPQNRLGEILIDETAGTFQRIQSEPIYFDVRLPRNFSKAIVSLTYKNLDQNIIELGAMVDENLWQFDLKPVENAIIDRLLQDKFRWSHVRDGNLILFQQENVYETVGDFLKNPPFLGSVATYKHDIEREMILEGYQPPEEGADIQKTLRGFHRFYTYIKDEPMEFRFWLQDVNRHAGDDYVSIDVYHKDEIIHSQFVKIDEITGDTLAMSETVEELLLLEGLSEGVYRIDLVTPSDDIFIRRIKARQKHVSFLNKLYLGDNVGYSDEFDEIRNAPSSVYSNVKYFSAETSHVEGIQALRVEDAFLSVPKTHQKFYFDTFFGEKTIRIAKNDIILEGNGLFSFSKDSFLNPEILSLADGVGFNEDSIKYVIANYSDSVQYNDGWKKKEIVFDVGKYYTKGRKMRFILSVPYLQDNDEGVLLSNIRVRLEAPQLTFGNIINGIKKIFSNE